MKRRRLALFLLIFSIGIAAPLMMGSSGCGGDDDKDKDQDAAVAFLIADHNTQAEADADPHEPDNNYNQAIARGYLPPSTPFNGTMWNTDIFTIDVPGGQLNVTIDCVFSHAQGDIDMWLDDANFDELAAADSIDDNETIIITVPSSGTHYIWVRQLGWLPDGQPYQLSWTCN